MFITFGLVHRKYRGPPAPLPITPPKKVAPLSCRLTGVVRSAGLSWPTGGRARRGPVPGDRLAYRLGLGVGEGEVERLGDLSLGVGDHDAGLFFDRRAPLRVVTGHSGAVAQQPEQRVGDGWLARAVAADEPAHRGQVFAEPPSRDDHHGP